MPKVIGLQKLDEVNPSGIYLVLISPESIPHLALVYKGKYFSLTHKKSIIGELFQPYYSFLSRANRKMIFIEINGDIENPEVKFGEYSKANLDAITCLFPIKDCLLPESKAEFVYELIPDLYLAGKINGAFHVNLEADLTDLGDFNLSIYPKKAIFSYIESLNEKYVKRQ
ncbi:MAG: hypothetical protein GQ574_27970 [Crocinitomix sp.]|nr:hypothetical protein [Crocinitomix sp.]